MAKSDIDYCYIFSWVFFSYGDLPGLVSVVLLSFTLHALSYSPGDRAPQHTRPEGNYANPLLTETIEPKVEPGSRIDNDWKNVLNNNAQ